MVADEILVKKAKDGDTGAYGELVRRYQDRVYGMAVRMLARPEDARDASQEIFVKAFRSLPDFNFRSRFRHMVVPHSVKHVPDMLRRRGREGFVDVLIKEGDGGYEAVHFRYAAAGRAYA